MFFVRYHTTLNDHRSKMLVQHSSIISPTRIIWLIADQSGCVQQTVDFHCRRTLSAGTASATSRNPLCGVFRLVGLHYRSSHRRPFAIPAGVTAFHSNQLASALYFVETWDKLA